MLNAIPFIGPIIALIINISLSIPFWIAWTCCGIGETYFYFLPERYYHIGFWSCVGLFTVAGILKCFVPSICSVSSNSK
jgi:hypothetical protein